MTGSQEPRPEFSRPLPVDRLGGGALDEEIVATAEERAALALRFDLRGLERLSARLHVHPSEGGRVVRVSGSFTADVTQTCVVSLEPVRNHLEESFTQLYRLAPAGAVAREVVVVVDEEAPEPFGPEGIDLGEAVAQQLALALDPYPRAPRARLPIEVHETERAEPEEDGPFAPLKALKRRS